MYTDEHGSVHVLARNTLLAHSLKENDPSWDFQSEKVTGLPWLVLRGIGYLLFKVGCERIPVDPDNRPALAAVSAYQAAQKPITVVNNTTSKGSWQDLISMALDPGDGETLKKAVRAYLQALERKTP